MTLPRLLVLAPFLAPALLVGCGDGQLAAPGTASWRTTRGQLAVTATANRPAAAPRPVPTPFAVGPAYRLPAASSAVRRGDAIGGLRCSAAREVRTPVHLELFVRGLVVLFPIGIGRGPGCDYPLRTREPTGVFEMAFGSRPSLGDLFAVWGQPLGVTRLARWRGAVVVYVDGKRKAGDPAKVALAPHAEVVLEVGTPLVLPHLGYRFPPDPPR